MGIQVTSLPTEDVLQMIQRIPWEETLEVQREEKEPADCTQTSPRGSRMEYGLCNGLGMEHRTDIWEITTLVPISSFLEDLH